LYPVIEEYMKTRAKLKIADVITQMQSIFPLSSGPWFEALRLLTTGQT